LFIKVIGISFSDAWRWEKRDRNRTAAIMPIPREEPQRCTCRSATRTL
jgi:hypothetical protein